MTHNTRSYPINEGFILLVPILLVLTIGASIVAYSLVKKTPEVSVLETPMPLNTSNTLGLLKVDLPTQAPVQTQSPTPVKTQAPVATQKPTSINIFAIPKTGAAKETDLFFRLEDGTITRTKYLNSFKDPETTHSYTLLESPVFDPIDADINEEILACVLLRSTQTINASRVRYKVFDETTLLTEIKIFDAQLGFDGINVCHRLPVNAGDHTITFVFNSDGAVGEHNYDNNVAAFSYYLKGDSDGPQFDIIGPNNLYSDGTCLWPGNITDNTTKREDLVFEHYVDGQRRDRHNSGGVCVTGAKGESHTYSVKAFDKEGNMTEKLKGFQLY